MRLLILAIAALGLSGCLSLSSSSPPQPASGTTVVVPQGTTVVKCPGGESPPC